MTESDAAAHVGAESVGAAGLDDLSLEQRINLLRGDHQMTLVTRTKRT